MLENNPIQENNINRDTILKFRDLSKLYSILCVLIELSKIFNKHEDIVYYDLKRYQIDWNGEPNNKLYIQIHQDFNNFFVDCFTDSTIPEIFTNINWKFNGQKEIRDKFNIRNITRENIQGLEDIILEEIRVINE